MCAGEQHAFGVYWAKPTFSFIDEDGEYLEPNSIISLVSNIFDI